MNTEMIKIFAKQEDRTSVSELITKLSEKLSISPFDMAIVLKGYEPFDVSYDSLNFFTFIDSYCCSGT